MNKALASGIDKVLASLVSHFSHITQSFSYYINWSLSSLNYTAGLVSPWFLILAVMLILFITNNRCLALGSGLGLAFIEEMNLWEQAIETVNLVFISSFLSIFIGLILGALGARYRFVYRLILEPLLDIMQAMPSFVYLIPMIPFFGIGSMAGIFATIIFAMPPVTRLTYLGLTNIPCEILEASRAFGSSNWHTFTKVRIPLAVPIIISGINQTIMMAISMIIIAAMVGAGGLGRDVLRAIDRLHFGEGIIAGLAVVVIAMILDRVTAEISKRYNYQAIRPKKILKESLGNSILKKMKKKNVERENGKD